MISTNIRDASIEAQKKGRGIARHKDEPRPTVLVLTNTDSGIIVQTPDRKIFPRWEPSFEDIAADDWFVIG